MRISKSCEKCLYDKQVHRESDEKYLSRIREILENRRPDDTAPYMVYLFNKVHDEMFGSAGSYGKIKRQYNDFVLNIEEDLRHKICQAKDPVLEALKYARVGNYIDFGAMKHVDEDQFIGLLEEASFGEQDRATYDSFIKQCSEAKNFLLICDNCGEIVLDKLFLEQLKSRFPNLNIIAMVRGGEALNDVTMEDATYVGMDRIAKVIDNGLCIAGTIYDMLPKAARQCVDEADVILSKGQGNYESLNGIKRHIFYSFLCKCDLFTDRFKVPQFAGIFIEES